MKKSRILRSILHISPLFLSAYAIVFIVVGSIVASEFASQYHVFGNEPETPFDVLAAKPVTIKPDSEVVAKLLEAQKAYPATGKKDRIFDKTELSKHNQAGDCFIAYKGIVYDLSHDPFWKDCKHHGMDGGVDLSNRYPHLEFYFTLLTPIGVYK